MPLLGLFSEVSSGMKRGNGNTLKYKKNYLNIRKHFLIVKVAEHRNKLPREVVKSTFFEDTQNQTGHSPGQTTLTDPAWKAAPSHLSDSVIQ